MSGQGGTRLFNTLMHETETSETIARRRAEIAADRLLATMRLDAIDSMVNALEPFVARSYQPGFDKVPDDAPVTFFAKDVRDALVALAKARLTGLIRPK